MDLNGQVVIITGASSGIGAHTAEHLASYKAKLVLVARSDKKLEDVKARCVAKGAKEEDVHIVLASVAKKEDLHKIIKSAVDTFGKIDHLINNAACLAMEDIEHSTYESYETVMDTNLRAPIFLSKEALPYLKKSKGSVVNISSINSQLAESRCAAYCISKAALEHFTRIFALEVATEGVRINAVVPGFVVTDTMLDRFPDDKKAEMEATIAGYAKKSQPLGGGLKMSAVSKAIHFFLSEASDAVTGECLRVDNGYHLALCEGMGNPQMNNTGLLNAEPTQERQAKAGAAKPS